MTWLTARCCAVFVVLTVVSAPAIAAADDTTVAKLVRGQDVTLSGLVERITDEDEFLLRDATGVVPVYVGPNRVPALVGETVTVHGTVDDDGPLEIYATAITLADGTRIELPYDY